MPLFLILYNKFSLKYEKLVASANPVSFYKASMLYDDLFFTSEVILIPRALCAIFQCVLYGALQAILFIGCNS